MEIMTNLLELYFEKVSPILNILHPGKFAFDFNSLVNQQNQEAAPSKANSYALLSTSSAVTPALVFSMLALAAPHHRLFQGKGDLIKATFYERSKRIILQTPEQMTLAVLKTIIHLSYFAVQHQLWTSAYFFHGYSVSVSRFLKITFLDMKPLSDNSPIGRIVAEESRRCFWYVICSDAAAAANSKRSHYFHNPEFENVYLPIADSIFYNDDPNNFIPTLAISQFYNPMVTALFLDPKAFTVALMTVFSHVTDFRRDIEALKISVTDTNSPHYPTYTRISLELEMFYQKLPTPVRGMDEGYYPSDWNQEMEQWMVLLVIYHTTYICLHGPEYNMMTMGQEVFHLPMAPHMKKFVRDISLLDQILEQWENSESFVAGLRHADRAVCLIKAKIERGKQANIENFDTPFFSYCCCQVVRFVFYTGID